MATVMAGSYCANIYTRLNETLHCIARVHNKLCLSLDISIHPETSIVTTTGSTIIFRCFSRNFMDPIVDFHWNVNGSSLQELNDTSNVVSEFIPPLAGYLTLSNISANHNLTSIQCEAELQSGTVTYSTITTLVVQG